MGWRFALSALALVLMADAAAADVAVCKPTLVASLEMLHEPDGAIAVMAGINGEQHRMLVDTSDLHSFLTSEFVESADLPQKHITDKLIIRTPSGDAKMLGVVDQLTLGSGIARDVKMVMLPANPHRDPGIAGSIGTNLLANFDVEFDFAASRINLLSGCTGVGAYWASRYAELPIDLKKLGRPAATWQLDGQAVTVTFSTNAPGSSMPFNVAKDKFGLVETSPGVETAGTDPHGETIHNYRFKLLTAEGVTVGNPLVRLRGNSDDPPCDGRERTRLWTGHIGLLRTKCVDAGDLTLGIREMSKMHLYFAFKENKLYFTAAGEH